MSKNDINSVPVAVLKKYVQMHSVKFCISGKSMEPTFLEGDEVYVEHTETINVGDIICFHNQKKYVIHRVVCNQNGLILTKGDNNNYIVAYNPNIEIVGCVKKKEKKIDKPHIIFVFWDKEEFISCKHIGDKLGVEMIYGEEICSEGCNIAISPYSTTILNREMINKSKVYIHIGMRIADFCQEGFVLDSNFDEVARGGSYQSMITLSNEEKFVILTNQVNLLIEES